MLQSRKHFSPASREKSVPSSRHIHQLVSLIVADDERVKTVRSRKVAADDELLPSIHAILDPSTASLSRLVQAVLSFPDDSFNPLLPDRRKKVLWCSLHVVANPGSLVLDHKQRFQQRTPFGEWKACQVAALPAQQIENVVVNPRRFSTEMLQKIEVGPAAV